MELGGIGVAEEERERLFRRHYRASGGLAGEEEETGLGLAIVRKTARPAGGDAWVEWDGGVTVFAVAFPLPSDAVSDGA